VGGHGNVGGKEAIEFYNKYLDDLEASVAEPMKSTQFGAPDPKSPVNNHAALMMPWLGRITAKVADAMRPTYGSYCGFEISVLANAEMVTLSAVSYR
jgi:hypothetical protein